MKKTVLSLFLIFVMMHQVSAQWTPQTSGVRNNLYDIAFYNANIGYAVGDAGTVLKTTTGGKKWTLVTAPDKSAILSVTIIDSASLMVTTSSALGSAAIYESKNGGSNWFKVLTDLPSFYATAAPDKSLYSVSSQIYGSNNFGKTWQAQHKLNPTSSYQQIAFSDNKTGIVAGNISGAVTYSADFLRTVDGTNWYNGYNFSFPNANGLSCFDAVSADSVFMFTNYYNRYMPGDSSQLILINHFKLQNLPGVSYWFFDNHILVNSFPDVINDCKFFSGGDGYAVSSKGTVYKVISGKKISKEYSSKTPLHAIYMLDKKNGFSVGDNGLILKRQPINSAETEVVNIPVSIYPNPAADHVMVNFTTEESGSIRLQVTNERGNIVLVQAAKLYNKGRQAVPVLVSNLPRGTYHISLLNSNGKAIGEAQLMVVH